MGEPSTQSFATRFTQRAETPPRAKLTAGSSYRLSDLKTQRKTLIEELGPTIPEVPIPNFLTNILPGLREGLDVDEIATKLKASGHITDDGRWSCFPCDPAQVKKREEQCFQPLEQLAEAISTASGGGSTRLLHYTQNPSIQPVCTLRDTKSRPDGSIGRTLPCLPNSRRKQDLPTRKITLRRLSGVCINACGRIPVDASRSASQLRTRRWDCGSAVVHSYLSARVSIFCRTMLLSFIYSWH
ncbi:hypothetical protein IEO21_08326 [Rhodonia placenta]|uniref:Uncharacterized protein n=1 Tax=Rhodonia placenta TaxID=104341 RepID=A0A8H7TZH7_9APHY|nr:hypothetical protein IEO21_08326 [Postia placenta]